MVIAVDDRDIDVGGAQCLGCVQPGKTRAQDDDFRTRFGTLEISHFISLPIDNSKTGYSSRSITTQASVMSDPKLSWLDRGATCAPLLESALVHSSINQPRLLW